MKVNITISTGYFARADSYINPIAIAMPPRSNKRGPIRNMEVYESLIPDWDSLSLYKQGIISADNFTKMFNDITLSKLNRKDVLIDLIKLARGFEFTLVGYEKGGTFSYRYLCQRFLAGLPLKGGNYIDAPLTFEYDIDNDLYYELIDSESFRRKQFFEKSKKEFTDMFSKFLDNIEKEIWKQ